ncbi:hypothetical protein [Zavarzinia sp. CC-PAN008]|uniref:hypothetical protein n=1 Tax=Zavarzinia sp. CC-PAN008 TaxID=3243332 RepID=UPI003F743A7D
MTPDFNIHTVFGVRPKVNDLSYVDRGSLDKSLRKLISRKQTHVAIRGASKSGKSWLRQRTLENPIVVQCRINYKVADIYRDVLSNLGISVKTESNVATGYHVQLMATGEVGYKILAKASGELQLGTNFHGQQTFSPIGKNLDDLEFISSVIIASERTLVVEDFHYLPVDEQKKFAFDLKTLWDFNVFVVVVGVWISENMLITLNPDLSDRIEELSVTWTSLELQDVFRKGCAHLRIEPSDTIVRKIADISYGSVGLLQTLALRLLDDEIDISSVPRDGSVTSLSAQDKVEDAAMHVADQLNQLYISFAKRVSDGIRTRANATGIYAHAMAVIMDADDQKLSDGLSAKEIHQIAHRRQPRIQLGNLKVALKQFQNLQVDSEGRGLVLAYDPQEERVSVVDRQLLLYRRYATVKWPWEELIEEVSNSAGAFD